jgi:glycosyltransferase involved in cell wall biosynthesis
MPLISICIPAYKNKAFVERLLQSTAIQTFKDFEVIITDDSPTNELEDLCLEFAKIFSLTYYKNDKPFGTPANWNFAISKAKGNWIKLMHHDDWFGDKNSLELFANTALDNPSIDFIFSGYYDVSDNNKKKYIINAVEKSLLKKTPLNLFKRNFIGSPSTTLIKNNRREWYDEKIKWVVDFEFYIRCLEQSKFISIEQALINIGIHSSQVTKQAFRNPAIEIPENLHLINKLGEGSLKNIFVYDYYWRLFRNLGIRDFDEINRFSNGNKLAVRIKEMLIIQFKIPLSVLKIGIVSKIFMLIVKTLK